MSLISAHNSPMISIPKKATEEVDWTGMENGACSALVYAAVFVLLAHWSFRRKDITS